MDTTLALQIKLYDSKSVHLANTLGGLEFVLDREGKTTEAEQLLDEQITASSADDPGITWLLRSRGKLRARLGRFAEAAEDFARVIERNPEDFDVWHWQATVLLQLGRRDAYLELRRKALGLFANTANV